MNYEEFKNRKEVEVRRNLVSLGQNAILSAVPEDIFNEAISFIGEFNDASQNRMVTKILQSDTELGRRAKKLFANYT